MATIFDYVKVKRPPKATFDLSHERKLSFNMGQLIPMLLEEIVPGDTFKVDSTILLRLAPMLAPIMHRVNVYTHYFFVPTRLVWEEFNDFMTGGDDGLAAPLYPFVTINEANSGNFRKGTLPDYYGIPVTTAGETVLQPITASAIPLRGYNIIFNEFYRDQNLQPKAYMDKSISGEDTGVFSLTQIHTRAWEKDYFTSAQPTAQKGPSVALPITVNYKPTSEVFLTDGTPASTDGLNSNVSGDFEVGDPAGGVTGRIENIDDTALGVNINELRTATRVQEWLELAQRGGSRIQEITRNFFGVTPDDLRLQVPQYLGGGKQSIVISEVLNTTGDLEEPTNLQPLGDMGGHGISLGKSNSFTKKFKEHGYVHGIISVLPRTAYQQGMHRTWSRREKFDFYWPQFAQLGEQEILEQEIYTNYKSATPDNEVTFGYAGRYAEMKYGCSSVHGEFRDTLSYWHMGQFYDSPPNLNAAFIESNPTHRIFAVSDPSEDKLYCQIFNRIKAVRPMPYFNDPTL